MPGSSLQEQFEIAKQRWPGVAWERAAFEKHLDREPCKNPEDLYLGGAAGHRIDQAWVVIETELGPATKKVLSRHALADFSPDELWSDTVGKLIAEDQKNQKLPDGRWPAYIIRYRGKISLLNFLILAARRIAIQRNRRLKPTMRIASDSDEDDGARHEPAAATDSPAQAAQESELIQRLERAVAAVWAELSSDQQFLLGTAAAGSMQQKEAGKLLGLSAFQANRAVKDAREKLESAMSEFKDIEWTDGLRRAWVDLLRKLCQDLQ